MQKEDFMIDSRVVLIDLAAASPSEKVDKNNAFYLKGVEQVINNFLNKGYNLQNVVTGEIDFYERKTVRSPILLIFTKDDGKGNPQDTTDSDPNRIQKP